MSVSLTPRVAVKRTREELKALAEQGDIELGSLTEHEASPADVVAWVARHFGADAAAVACSMADAALPHLVAEQLPGVDVLFLDTGYHFAETRYTRDEVGRALDVRIVDVLPEQTVAQQDAEFGAKLHDRDPALCCERRKVGPLKDALGGYEVWFTGVRREEAPTRTNTPLVTWDERNGLVKVNPVAAWTFDDLLDYAGAHQVPVNLLVSNGYPSIGCEPCTKPVALGEDPRSGRWAGLSKTECGLHV
jgi:phosphoadenosine phosphosulfate reductase